MADSKPATAKDVVVEPPKAPEIPMKFGIPAAEYDALSYAEQRRVEMSDIKSPLRNQVTVDDVVDYQLLSNTPAQIVEAMTGWSLQKLQERADKLEVTLKGSLAGDGGPR